MVKRVLLVAIVVAAILVVAAPALAFNGARADYTPSTDCAVCHTDTPGIPQIYTMWSETKHAEADSDNQHTRLPYGSVCAGCHTGELRPEQGRADSDGDVKHRCGHLGRRQRDPRRRPSG